MQRVKGGFWIRGKPISGGRPNSEDSLPSVERGSLLGTPTYQWINGRQRVKDTCTIFLAQVPAGFAVVADVRTEPGQIVIIERDTNRQIRVPSTVQRSQISEERVRRPSRPI